MSWVGWKSVVVALAILAADMGAAPAQSDDTVDALNAKVEELYKIGKYADAVSIAQRAIALAEMQSGPDHLTVAPSLEKLAILYYRQGSFAHAEPLNRRALAIREGALGPDHPDVATTLNTWPWFSIRKVGMLMPNRYSGARSVSGKGRWGRTTGMSPRRSTI